MKRFIVFELCLIVIPVAIASGIEPGKGYRGYVDFALGDAYNLNTAQTISTNNMQLYSMLSTTHGYKMNDWFVGGGVGYYHSFRDGENMYPVYAAGRYTFGQVKMNPYIEMRAGIICDPRWVYPVQAYGALGAGMNVYKKLQVGVRFSCFSRPSRYFTANAAIVLIYAFGR